MSQRNVQIYAVVIPILKRGAKSSSINNAHAWRLPVVRRPAVPHYEYVAYVPTYRDGGTIAPKGTAVATATTSTSLALLVRVRYRTGRLAALADLKIHTGCNAFLLHHASLRDYEYGYELCSRAFIRPRGPRLQRVQEVNAKKLYRVPVADGTLLLQVLLRSCRFHIKEICSRSTLGSVAAVGSGAESMRHSRTSSSVVLEGSRPKTAGSSSEACGAPNLGGYRQQHKQCVRSQEEQDGTFALEFAIELRPKVNLCWRPLGRLHAFVPRNNKSRVR
eukprot:scaffold3916_cov27-Prasinocladus_malaysianus.AAC.1